MSALAARTPHDVRHLIGDGERADIGRELVRRGLVTQRALQAAEMERRVTGGRIGPVLVRNGLLRQRDLIRTILDVAPEELASERVAHSRIPLPVLRQYKILLAAETEDRIYVATRSDERVAARVVSEWYPDREISFVGYDPEHMTDFLTRLQMTVGAAGGGDVSQEDRLEDLIYKAYDRGASDIHVVPKPRSYTVFFRLLGERHLVHEGSISEYRSLVAQIKNRAGMDIAETRLPQDGVFNMEFASKVVDFRTVTVPVQDGEYVVLRILDPDAVRNNLDELGISRVDLWRMGFRQANGLCLICGPTGSGKTTTLNATVAELDRFGDAIFTVEDPVEYPISYSGQVTINEGIGLTYPRALRAFMRADPDIINIGEVRDEETARTMIRAAETGHMVLATLHASTIRGAISRLEYLNIPPRDLRYITRSIMVQNLVRTLCPSCHGAGCEKCYGTGYGGRTIASEVQYFQNEHEFDRMDRGEVFWPTLISDAVDLMERGRTDLRELDRVYGAAAHEEVARRKAASPGG